VYFGDAGSAAVLHSVGAERAACAVITLDTPGEWAGREGRGREGEEHKGRQMQPASAAC
jgi:hypothetical protein